jgi:hypothetical protein
MRASTARAVSIRSSNDMLGVDGRITTYGSFVLLHGIIGSRALHPCIKYFGTIVYLVTQAAVSMLALRQYFD